MARLLWLADVLRAAGLTVHEVAGWRSRGLDEMNNLAGVICHATAGSRSSTAAGDIGVLLNGSATAPPPISQLYLARNGDWHVIASGICYHAGSGGLWGVAGNDNVIGVEAANDNRGEPWPSAQYGSYVRGVAAILRHLGLPAARAGAHREWSTTGKTDPVGINMTTFRAQVAAAITEGDDDMFTDDDRTVLKNVQGRAAEVYPIKAAVLTILEGVSRMDGLDDQIKAQLDATRSDLAATRAELLAEVDQSEESLAEVKALLAAIQDGDPDDLADKLIARFGPAAAQLILDAMHARLAG